MSTDPATDSPLLPPEIECALAQFLADRRTGNVQINVKDGRILGAHVTEMITPTPKQLRVTGRGKTRTPGGMVYMRGDGLPTGTGRAKRARVRQVVSRSTIRSCSIPAGLVR